MSAMSSPLSPADQLAAIQQTAFFTALQSKFRSISAAMQANGFKIDGLILVEVNQVPVVGSISLDGSKISLSVGQDTNGQALFAWSAPAAWVAAAAPANTVLPAITGTAQSGQVLVASDGTWTGTTPITFTYQWQSSADGVTWTAIAGATGSSYTVAVGDVGNELRVAVTASNSAGSATADSAATVAAIA